MSTIKTFSEIQEPIYWFTLLERAIHRHDYVSARTAIDRLRILGVEVRFVFPPVVDGDQSKGDRLDAEQRYAEDAEFRNLVLSIVAVCAKSGKSMDELQKATELALFRLRAK